MNSQDCIQGHTSLSEFLLLWFNYLNRFVSQTLLDCIRLKMFGKFGLQRMQVDYLQLCLSRFVSDEKSVVTSFFV